MKKNVLFIQKLFHYVNQDDLSHHEEFFSKNVLVHGPASNQKIRGLAEAKKIDSSYVKAYPKKQFILEELFEQGDKVMVQWKCSGKYANAPKGIKPKNLHFTIAGFSIYRIEKDKIVEIWQFWDRLGLLEQLGEVVLHTDAVRPGYYLGLLKSMGMEQYADQVPSLTKRERQCLECMLEGKTAKETAGLFKLSPRTIETHFEKIKQKLKCTNKRDLFTLAQSLQKLDLL